MKRSVLAAIVAALLSTSALAQTGESEFSQCPRPTDLEVLTRCIKIATSGVVIDPAVYCVADPGLATARNAIIADRIEDLQVAERLWDQYVISNAPGAGASSSAVVTYYREVNDKGLRAFHERVVACASPPRVADKP